MSPGFDELAIWIGTDLAEVFMKLKCVLISPTEDVNGRTT